MAWPTPVQTYVPTGTGFQSSGHVWSLTSNGTTGNTVVVLVLVNASGTVSSITSTMGTPSAAVGSWGPGQASVGSCSYYCYLIPITVSGNNTITVNTSGPGLGIFAQEYPGTVTGSNFNHYTQASGSNPALTVTTSSGSVVMAFAEFSSNIVSGFTGTGTGTFTDENTGLWAWSNYGDAVYASITGGTSATFTWTSASIGADITGVSLASGGGTTTATPDCAAVSVSAWAPMQGNVAPVAVAASAGVAGITATAGLA